MFQDTISLAAMADTLSRSPDYRVLRRLIPRIPSVLPIGQDTRTAVLLDTETTGLDPQKNEIIELGMVKFDYFPDGRIAGVRDSFSAFNEPSEPIPSEITALTGITDDMVVGQRFDDTAVTAFVDDAAIVIAHNSGFRQEIRGAVLAGIRTQSLGLLGDRDRVAQTWLRGRAARLPFERRRLLPCRPPRRRRLPRLARNPGVRTPDDWRAGARTSARDCPQADGADLGGAIAVRSQGLLEASRLQVVRRQRRQTEELVRRRLRDPAAGRDRVPPDRDLSTRRGSAAAELDGFHAFFQSSLTLSRSSLAGLYESD